MKIKGRKSSNIIDARSDEVRIKEEAKTRQYKKVLESPRALVNEPVAWNNDKSAMDRMVSIVNNPGRNPRSKIRKPPAAEGKDPQPQKLSKGRKRKNYENIPDFEFFKHTTKGK